MTDTIVQNTNLLKKKNKKKTKKTCFFLQKKHEPKKKRFFPISMLIARVQELSRIAMSLVAPLWPEKEWFADLLLLLTQPPLALPCCDRLLRQPHCSLFHQGVHALNLHAWRDLSVTTESRAFREGLLESWQGSCGSPPLDCTSRDGRSSVVGVVEGALLQSTPLYQ